MDYDKIYTQYMYSYPHKRAYHFTEKLELSSFKDRFIGKEMSLYIHVPFCKSKCGYCNLFSITNVRSDEYREYIKAVKRHSKQMRSLINFENTNFNSFTLGGGTPMILSPKDLSSLFELARDDFNMDLQKAYSIIEGSPRQISVEKLNLLNDFSLKRLSIGVQSFIDSELLTIQRAEKSADVYKALEIIKTYDFDTNIDLIYGIPEQNEETLIFSIDEALKYNPTEIFLYPLYKQVNARLYDKFDIDVQKQYKLYQIGRDYLISKGYEQLSMRSFSKNSKINANCGFEDVLSLGCGGRSYFENLHFCEKYVSEKKSCESEYEKYLKKDDFTSDISYYILDDDEMKRRYVIKNLLYISGLSISDYYRHFASDLESDFSIITNLLKEGYAQKHDDIISLTPLGMSLSDMIGPMFMSQTIQKRMNNYD